MRKSSTIGFVFVVSVAGLILLSACTKSSTAPVSAAPPAAESQTAEDASKADAPSAEFLQMQAEAEAKARAERIKFMDEDIYFDKGSYALDAEAREILKRKAEWLRNNSDAVVIIEGHTDELGSKEYNFALGDRRAGAVKTFFLNEGIATQRLIAVSYGNERPIATSGADAGRGNNRRVHLVVE